MKDLVIWLSPLTRPGKSMAITSMDGIVTVTLFDIGKVLDFECLSKYCNFCTKKSIVSEPEKIKVGLCFTNYLGIIGRIEVVGVKVIYARSENKLHPHYTR